MDANYLVSKYNMVPHPEGGFYVETFRSDTNVSIDSEDGQTLQRPASTAIYFLMVPGNISRFHRIKSDEIWHFYGGGSMTVVELIDPPELKDDGTSTLGYKTTVLGTNLSENESVQYVVKKDTWFGSFPNDGSDYSFVGCTVSPGFVFDDFELASREKLLLQYPSARDMILKLTEGLP